MMKDQAKDAFRSQFNFGEIRGMHEARGSREKYLGHAWPTEAPVEAQPTEARDLPPSVALFGIGSHGLIGPPRNI